MNYKGVTFDVTANPRKYYRFGANLLGFAHGDSVKREALPMLMATESAHDWAEAKHRVWHTGHLHHNKKVSFKTTDTIGSVEVLVLPSLSGSDAWHHRAGYNAPHKADAFVWDAERGLDTTFTFNPADTDYI